MEKNLKCEVLIVGAGPAGASLASYLAGAGIESILIDKKQRIDTPLRCAEYVPVAIGRLFDGPISGISRSTISMDTYIDYEYANTIPSPGFMLDRPVFLKSLIEDFMENSGRFMPGTRAVSFDGGNSGCKTGAAKTGIRHRDHQNNESSKKNIQQKESWDIGLKKEGFRNNDSGMISTLIHGSGGERSIIRSKIVVGADGPNSIVGKYMGSTNSRYVLGLGENIPVEVKDKKRTLIFFSPEIEGGYGWLFPKEGSTNLGIGCQFSGNRKNINTALKKKYKDFKKKIFLMDFFDLSDNQSNKSRESGHIRSGEQIDVLLQPLRSGLTAGLIPASGMLKKTVSERFILAGDAAGLTNPITGAGIYNGVLSAKIISNIIPRALKAEDPGLLAMIEEDYKNTFSVSLRRAVEKRKKLMSGWKSSAGSGDMKNFKKLIEQCWVSFKDYWRP